jgi:NADH-quinone oxidoreductase subunit E
MLSEAILKEVDEEARQHPHKPAACLDALRVVQRHLGWVDDDSLRAVSSILGMTPDEVESLATFFNHIYRRPVGRHVILLCDSVSCWIMKYDSLLTWMAEELGIKPGETSADGRFTLIPNVCLGACDKAPVLMVDGTLYGNLDCDKLKQILEQYP